MRHRPDIGRWLASLVLAVLAAQPMPVAILGLGWSAWPVCEAMIDGRYYWVPFERIRSVALQAPSDLRDFVWMPAQLVLANGSALPDDAYQRAAVFALDGDHDVCDHRP